MLCSVIAAAGWWYRPCVRAVQVGHTDSNECGVSGARRVKSRLCELDVEIESGGKGKGGWNWSR